MANTDPFTPEEVAQILEAFFATVGTRQYVGARYVPIFGRRGEASIVWDNTAPYEPLTIVLYQGNSFTSRQYVPEGVEITNEEFWAETGNYNAQIEQYRQEVQRVSGLLPVDDFDQQDTVKAYIDRNIERLEVVSNLSSLYINAEKPKMLGWTKIHDYEYQRLGAGCPITDNIYAQCYSSDYTTTGRLGAIEVIDFSTNESTLLEDINIGHANGVCFDPETNLLYVVVGRYGTSASPIFTQDIKVFSYNPGDNQLTYQTTLRPSWRYQETDVQITGIAYDQTSGKFYVCTRNCAMFADFDPNTGTITNTRVVSKVVTSGATQSIAAYNGYIYMLLAIPNMVSIFRATDGEYCGLVTITEYNDVGIKIREAEGMGFYNGNLYLNAYLGTHGYGQVLSLSTDRTSEAYYNYLANIYFNVEATDRRGNGRSSARPLPDPRLLSEMAFIQIYNVSIKGNFENYDTQVLSLYNPSNVAILDFSGSSNIRELVLYGFSTVFITDLAFVGRPTNAQKAALAFMGGGSIQLRRVNFSASILNTYDIYLGSNRYAVFNDLTARENDTIHVHRSLSTNIAVPSTGVNLYTVTGAGKPTFI